jgi:collagen type III alpha
LIILGGSAITSASNYSAGIGGGSGAYFRGVVSAANISTGLTVTVGSNGVGGSSGASGTAGGTTTVTNTNLTFTGNGGVIMSMYNRIM